MKCTGKFISLILLSAILISSCAKEPDADFPDDNIYALRSIVYKGETTNKFLYNPNGKIAEAQSFYYCEKYTYDENDRLVKVEGTSSLGFPQSNELMTSQNSVFGWYSTYEYSQNGILNSIRNYRLEDGVYKHGAIIGFEYEGGNIVKENILNDGDTITQFYAYEYDNNRNIINMKQYSYLFIVGPGPELIRETTYKYDNKNNPYSIFKEKGSPGVFTNTNNIVETNSTFYEDIPGIDKYTTSKKTYEYNDKGFPVKEIIGTTVYEYVY